jgi:hypothetical protein
MNPMAAEWREQIAQLPRHVLWHLVDLFERHVRSVDGDDEYVKWADIQTLLALPPRAQEKDHVEAVDSRERDLAADSGVRGVELPTVTERPCPPPVEVPEAHAKAAERFRRYFKPVPLADVEKLPMPDYGLEPASPPPLDLGPIEALARKWLKEASWTNSSVRACAHELLAEVHRLRATATISRKSRMTVRIGFPSVAALILILRHKSSSMSRRM